MTSSNFAYALDQDFPALPKWLFVYLADAHGQSEFYDVTVERHGRRTGMTSEELEASLFALESYGVLRVLRPLPPETPGWHIQFTYPGEYGAPSSSAAPAPRQRDTRPGWLYVIGTPHGVTKVGITTHLPSRAQAIVTNAAVDARLAWSHQCPIADARDFERALLEHFLADKFKGEWIRRSAEEVIAVARDLTGHGPP